MPYEIFSRTSLKHIMEKIPHLSDKVNNIKMMKGTIIKYFIKRVKELVT